MTRNDFYIILEIMEVSLLDIKSATDLLQMSMLKKIVTDESTDSLTGSGQNSDMFKMMLESLIENAVTGETSLNGGSSDLSQIQALSGGNTDLTQLQALSGGNMDMTQLQTLIGDNADLTKILELYNTQQKDQSNTLTSSSDTSSESIEVAIQAAAKKYGVDEDFIKAMIKQESSFKTDAVSKAGAIGLMQLMPKTAESLGVNNPFNVMENVDGGTKYIKKLMDSFGGSKELALSAYNGGISRMNRRGVDTTEEIANMPKETQNYVNKVMKAYESYKKG
jgi:soluble lytic murein transglycosylase-like protein